MVGAGSFKFLAGDASGYRMDLQLSGTLANPISLTTVVTDPNGTRYIQPSINGPTTEEDTNGNQITVATIEGGWTDTMGRTIPAPPNAVNANTTDYSGCSGPLPITAAATWTIPGLNGGNYTLKFCYVSIPESIQVCTYSCATYNMTDTQMQSVVRPDGTTWTFEYNAPPIGSLAKITFPTGGTLSYAYNTNGVGAWPLPPSSYTIAPQSVGTRTMNPNDGHTPSGTWTYVYTGTVPNTNVTVTDPGGNGTVHKFGMVGISGTGSYTGLLGYEANTLFYQGSPTSGSLLETVHTDYLALLGAADPNTWTNVTVVPVRTTTTLSNGQQTKSERDYDSGFVAQSANLYYNSSGVWNGGCTTTCGKGLYGRVVATRAYDYGNGAPGSLLRTTTTSYLAFSNLNYLTANLLDLPSSVQVTGSGPGSLTEYGYDAAGGVHGNLTSTSRWLNTTGGYLTISNVYDSYGRVTSTTDPKNNTTTYGYTPSSCPSGSGYAGWGPNSVTNALGQTTHHCYDLNIGLVTSTTDPNNLTTSTTYDDMLRTTQISYPDGGSTSFTYPSPNEVDISEKISSSANRLSYLLVDGVGREIRQAVTNGEATKPYDEIDTCYDGNGRVSFKSYAFQDTGPFSTSRTCASPEAGDTFAYDGLNRTKTVTHSDGSVISSSYDGNATTVTDEQTKTRESFTDGLGRLAQIIENPGGLSYTTTYTLDALDNLTGVTQAGSRQRTFVYDSLARLTSSTNPEANWSPGNLNYVATTYSYDADGNLINKTEPAQNQQGTATVTLTYCYDALNRMIAKAYTLQPCTSTGGRMATPLVSYVYDGAALPSAPAGCTLGTFSYGFAIGRRTAMCEGTGEVEGWSYSITSGQGWKTTDQRTTNSLTKTSTYQYNFLGSPTSITYPSGRVINYAYNPGDRPTSATDQTTLVNYASTLHYWAGGSPCWAAYGAAITAAETYNARLQPLNMQATGSVIAYPGSCSGLGQTGNLLDLAYNFNYGSGDNGNVMGITNNLDGTRSQTFAYDALNRIVSAQTTSTHATSPTHCWGETYQFDGQPTGGAWGSLSAITQMTGNYAGCTGEVLAGITVTAQNRISNGTTYYYDTAGNMTTNAGVSNSYDAENHLVSSAGVTYTYNGDGARIKKSNGVIDWLGVDGSVLDRTDLSGSVTNSNFHEFFFLGGRRIARRDSANNVIYYAADHLGTSRVIAQVNSGSHIATLCYDADFYPFGGERAYTNTCNQAYKFTGKERDSESGLDNFGARYNSSQMGRFMSPDPVNILKQKLFDPQQWNMYAYVRNSPLRFVDPRGKWIELLGNDEDRKKELGALQQAVGKKAGSYLYDNSVVTKDENGNTVTKHYVGIRQGGSDGKGPSFGSINAAANKIGGIIADTSRGEQIAVVSPGTLMGGKTPIGSLNMGMTPGDTLADPYSPYAITYITSGPVGDLPGRLMSNGEDTEQSLGDVISHELGHVDSAWYHGGADSDGDAVRQENQTRQMEGEPLRIGHQNAGDVQLNGQPY
jgi:RHS repeat-associated protein